MPVYQYEGKHYSLPDGLSKDDAIAKIETHLGKRKPAEEDNSYGKYFKKVGESVLGAAETGLNIIGGAGAGLVAPIGAAINSVNNLAQGQPADFQKGFESLLGHGSQFGTNLAEVTGLRTEAGDKMNEGVGEAMNQVGIPLGGVAHTMPSAHVAEGIRGKILEQFNPKAPENAGKLSALDQILNKQPEVTPTAEPAMPVVPTGDFVNPSGKSIDVPQAARDQQAINNRNLEPVNPLRRNGEVNAVDHAKQQELPFAAGPEEIVRENYLKDFTEPDGVPMQRDMFAEQDLKARDADPVMENRMRAAERDAQMTEMDKQADAVKKQQIEEAYKQREEADAWVKEQERQQTFDDQWSKVEEAIGPLREGKGSKRKSMNQMRGQRGAIILAEKADKDITLARSLYKQKMSPATIFDLTGAYRDIDGKWKTVVSDANAKVKDAGFNKGRGNLRDMLDHPTLFKFHPELENIFVMRTEHSGATYYREKKGMDVIHIDDSLPKADFRRILLHEIQHGIQENSKFNRGGSADNLSYKYNLPRDKAYSHYDALAGEQEARFVENSADLPQGALSLKTKGLLQEGSTPSDRIPNVKTQLSKRIIPAKQRGAIDLEEIAKGLRFYKDGFISGTDLLNTFKGAFTEKELGNARRHIQDRSSTSTIAMLTPDQFRELAASRTPAEMNSKMAEQSRADVREGLASDGGLWDIPYLRVGNDGQILAHEGRHRADVFKEQGVELIPVRIEGRRWGEEGKPAKIIPEDFKNSGKAMKEIAGQDFPDILTPTPKLNVPRGQSGRVDVKAIGEAITDLVKKVVGPSPKEGLSLQVKAREPDLPGMEGVMKDYIPEDPKPGDIIRDALAGKDSSLTMNSVQSGGTLTGIKYNSPLIRGVSQLYQNATKRAEKYIRDNVNPVEHTIKSLAKGEVDELAGLMKREMFEGKTVTIQQLNEAGFSPKQIDAYVQLRQMQKEALKVQNDALVKMGKEPITERDAYLSSRWHGDYHVPVYDKTGRLIWYIAETSSRKAKDALDYIAKNGFEVDRTKSKVEFRGQTGENRPSNSVQDAYRTMLGVIDSKDPRSAALKSIMEEAMANEGFNTLGQKQHFLDKNNVRGFVGDRPWRNQKAEPFELFKEQFAYTKNAHNWAELSKATESTKEIFANEQLNTDQPNNMAYARDYAKNKLGFGENSAVVNLENQLMKQLGTSRQQFKDIVGGAKSYFIASKLGFNVGYMGINFVQPLFTASWHSNLVSQGYKHNAFKTFVLAGQDGFGGFLTHEGYKVPMTELGREGLKYAEDNGIINRGIYDEGAHIGENPTIETLRKVSTTMTQASEHMARFNAFMGFVHHLDQSGKFTHAVDLFQAAEHLVDASMVDYRSGETPMIYQKAGVTGQALATLQTFKYNYYNQLHYFSKEAAEGRPKGLVTFMLMQATLGGMLSMPFVQEADDMVKYLKKILPDDLYLKVKDFDVRSQMIKTLPEWAAYGGVSKLTGADLTKRFNPGNLTDLSLDQLFPFVSDLYKQGKAVADFATNPNQTTGAVAAHAVLPPGPLQGIAETEMSGLKGKTNAEGNTPYYTSQHAVDHNASYVRTPQQETKRKFGVTDLQESRYKDLRYSQQQNEKESTDRQKKAATNFYDAMFRGSKEDMQKYASRYVAFEGDPDTLIKGIQQQALNAQIPKETIDAANASTRAAIMKAKRMKELLNGFNK